MREGRRRGRGRKELVKEGEGRKGRNMMEEGGVEGENDGRSGRAGEARRGRV